MLGYRDHWYNRWLWGWGGGEKTINCIVHSYGDQNSYIYYFYVYIYIYIYDIGLYNYIYTYLRQISQKSPLLSSMKYQPGVEY